MEVSFVVVAVGVGEVVVYLGFVILVYVGFIFVYVCGGRRVGILRSGLFFVWVFFGSGRRVGLVGRRVGGGGFYLYIWCRLGWRGSYGRRVAGFFGRCRSLRC